MSDQISLLEVLISWAPMLLLIAVWIYFMRGYFGKGRITQARYLEEDLAESKRHHAALEELLRDIKEVLARGEGASKKTTSL